jgi:hypothetical protein
MKTDAALNRTKTIRSKISAECAHGPEKLVDYSLDMQNEDQDWNSLCASEFLKAYSAEDAIYDEI